MVDFSVGFDSDRLMEEETARFLERLKENFVDYASAFNQMKGVSIGNIKIYGIANTRADFMLFRNGLKLIFAMKRPGVVAVRVSQAGGFFPGAQPTETAAAAEEDTIEAQWGAFNELFWTHRKMQIHDSENMVRFYLSRFIRESAR
jgi:hypothetical protein